MTAIVWQSSTVTYDDSGEGTLGITEHILEFDCVLREVHESSSVITDHAVESGAAISDHKRPNPRKVHLTGEITDHPAGDPPLSGTGGTQIRSALTRIELADAQVMKFETAFFRAREVFGVLQNLSLDDVSVTVENEMDTYENMQIESANLSRDAGLGGTLNVEIVLREIRIAETRTGEPQPMEARGQREQDRGGQEGEEVEDDGPQTSVLRGLSEGGFEDAGDFLGGIFGMGGS
jgi:hypothetical protein